MVHSHEALGAPDLRIAGFQLWIRRRQFPDAADYWDGNWLQVIAHCGAGGASVWVDGPVLMVSDLDSFADECAVLHERLAGRATLDSYEPNLRVSLASEDRSGHLVLRVEITPDHIDQQHTFRFSLDQSYVPGILSQCRDILRAYPVRGRLETGTAPAAPPPNHRINGDEGHAMFPPCC